MRYSLILVLMTFLTGCGERHTVSLQFPMFESCRGTLENVKENLTREAGAKYRLNISIIDYDVTPRYGYIPSGLGVLTLEGEIELIGEITQKDYLTLSLQSMYSECMPNNGSHIGDQALADRIRSEVNSSVFQGYIDDNGVWVFINDGSYTYLQSQ